MRGSCASVSPVSDLLTSTISQTPSLPPIPTVSFLRLSILTARIPRPLFAVGPRPSRAQHGEQLPIPSHPSGAGRYLPASQSARTPRRRHARATAVVERHRKAPPTLLNHNPDFAYCSASPAFAGELKPDLDIRWHQPSTAQLLSLPPTTVLRRLNTYPQPVSSATTPQVPR